jgi:hypothetical protein
VVSLKISADKAFIGNRQVKLDVPAQVIDGRTLVPLRFVGEAVDANVHWDAATQTVSIETQ